VHSLEKTRIYREYKIKPNKEPILKGIAIGGKIGQGKVRIISDVSKLNEFQKGEVLVAKMTDPDWLPAMLLASAIVTDEGGKTAHAAIVSRELGIPAIVGAQKATQVLETGDFITVDCSQGLNGRVFSGKIPFKIKRYKLKKDKRLRTKLMLNIGSPDIAFKASFLPNDGVGLARIEFILAQKIKIHPLALYHYSELKDEDLKKQINALTVEHKDKREFFIKELAEGIGQIAAAFYPKPVIVRLSDFRTNEYSNLVGGNLFENNNESNPMLGFRGAARYVDKEFQPAFEMECHAIKRAREVFGLKNIIVMVPFCRTVEQGEKVVKLMERFGLQQGKDGLLVYAMCEIPSNVILAEDFLEVFDGYSIGSNDSTQLILGTHRDNAKIAHIADERNEAVKIMIKDIIKICKRKNKYCGICGEAPSDFPDFARFLVQQGIESMSLSTDAIIKIILGLTKKKL